MNILEKIAAHARSRVAGDAAAVPLEVLQAQCRQLGRGQGIAFDRALRAPGIRFIC